MCEVMLLASPWCWDAAERGHVAAQLGSQGWGDGEVWWWARYLPPRSKTCHQPGFQVNQMLLAAQDTSALLLVSVAFSKQRRWDGEARACGRELLRVGVT